MNTQSNRRTFLKKSAAAAVSAPLIMSLEEYALAEQGGAAAPPPAGPSSKATLPTGVIGKVNISRLICGGNLINGYAHSRDLVYVSTLLQHYFTDEKILQTWSLCEQHGVNTMILHPGEARAVNLYQQYRAQGGRIQYIAQIEPAKNDLLTEVQRARDAGAVGAFLVGNLGDGWTRDGDVKLIGKLLSNIKAAGLIAGVAGHELRTVQTIEKEGLAPDFYMKTLHDTNYWSSRRPDQLKEVIDNYASDNYWCRDPKETIAYMSEVDRPWIAYKVLAAGAIDPRAGFKHAYENGADFAAVGMFDFQIADDVAVANTVLKTTQNRDRKWFGSKVTARPPCDLPIPSPRANVPGDAASGQWPDTIPSPHEVGRGLGRGVLSVRWCLRQNASFRRPSPFFSRPSRSWPSPPACQPIPPTVFSPRTVSRRTPTFSPLPSGVKTRPMPDAFRRRE